VRCRFAVAKLLPLICVFLSVSVPSRNSLVESFVLRRHDSLAQLGDVLDVDAMHEDDDENDDDEDFIDRLSSMDIRRLEDQVDDQPISG